MKRNRKSILTGMFLVVVLCSALITPTLADNQLTVPLYGQAWKDWGGDMIGTSSTSMAAAGCAITSIAMILGYYGMDKADSNPGKVNKYLTSCEGLNGPNLKPFGWNECIREMSGGNVQWKDRVRGSKNNKINRLNQEIDNGYPVIIEIPFGGASHFMVVTGRKGTTYYLNDPLERDTTREAWQSITSLVIYHGPIPTRIHLDGTLIQSIDDKIYRLINVRKIPIASDNVFHSWNFKEDQVVKVSNKELAKYEEIEQIVFMDGTLIGDQATDKRYAIENEEKRLISDDAFIQLGYKDANVVWLTEQSELDLCPDGEPIDFQESTIWHPQGTLIKSEEGNDIYEVLLGLGGHSKKLIPTANVFNARYGNWNRIIEISDSQLNQYTTTSNPFGFPDGALILHGFDLYIIAGNEKRHIENTEIKDILGYTWDPITVDDEEFNLHQQGEDITKKNSVKYSTIYVPDDYSTIQEAVDSAEQGDTIIVRDGTYIENVKINKRLTLIGEGEAIVRAENQYDHVFEITADYVNISRFTTTEVTKNAIAGFYLLYANCCNISDNTANENKYGIMLIYSNGNTVSDNTINGNNHGFNIYLHNSNNNILSENVVSKSDLGIYLCNSNDNTISGNIVNENNHYGIYPYSSSNNNIYLNNFIGNAYQNAYSKDSANTYNSPDQITYTHNGNMHTSYLGNYYSDYTDIDSDSDGIWDSPYNIDSDTDNYPLTQPFQTYLPKTLSIKVFCPVNLSVTDPDGLTINIETNEISEATYTETDINGDGDPDDIITIPNRKTGNYEITVIPELNANPSDTFTLEVSSDETSFFLAENVSISDIPNQPYVIESNESGITDKTLINPQGGIGIAVLPRINHITSGSIINFTIKIVSTENFDDTFHIYIDNKSLPASWRADIEWFNWTTTNISIPSGEEATIQLRADIPINVSGNKAFRVMAKSTLWTPVAFDTGILYIS